MGQMATSGDGFTGAVPFNESFRNVVCGECYKLRFWLLNSHRAYRWDLAASREVLQFFLAGLLPLRPLVEAGIIVLLSQAHVLMGCSGAEVADALADADRAECRRRAETP